MKNQFIDILVARSSSEPKNPVELDEDMKKQLIADESVLPSPESEENFMNWESSSY